MTKFQHHILFTKNQTKFVIKFLASQTLRFIFNHPLSNDREREGDEGKSETQKFEYLENEKNFLDEVKCIFRSYSTIICYIKEK